MLQKEVRMFQTRSSTRASIFTDAKHAVLMKNYPVSVFGVLDTLQYFLPLHITVKNRKHCTLYEDMISGVHQLQLKEESTLKIAALYLITPTLLLMNLEILSRGSC